MINISRKAADQAETLRAMNSPDPAVTLDPGENRVTRVYSITSGKGGVGKTAVVANIAVSLARLGKNVLILDADLGLANIDVVFGIAPAFNLNHFLLENGSSRKSCLTARKALRFSRPARVFKISPVSIPARS